MNHQIRRAQNRERKRPTFEMRELKRERNLPISPFKHSLNTPSGRTVAVTVPWGTLTTSDQLVATRAQSLATPLYTGQGVQKSCQSSVTASKRHGPRPVEIFSDQPDR